MSSHSGDTRTDPRRLLEHGRTHPHNGKARNLWWLICPFRLLRSIVGLCELAGVAVQSLSFCQHFHVSEQPACQKNEREAAERSLEVNSPASKLAATQRLADSG